MPKLKFKTTITLVKLESFSLQIQICHTFENVLIYIKNAFRVTSKILFRFKWEIVETFFETHVKHKSGQHIEKFTELTSKKFHIFDMFIQ